MNEDAREYVASQSDDELLVMLSRQLSQRLRALGLTEARRRDILDLVGGDIS